MSQHRYTQSLPVLSTQDQALSDPPSPSQLSSSTILAGHNSWRRDHIAALIRIRSETNSVKFNIYIYINIIL